MGAVGLFGLFQRLIEGVGVALFLGDVLGQADQMAHALVVIGRELGGGQIAEPGGGMILAGVAIVTGDTKVVDRGNGDGLYINTSGIGIIEHDLAIGAQSIRAGDVILLSGDIGRHGICILAEREKLAFESTIESDTAALHQPVLALIEAGLPIHCLRDLTRGGLASALKELMLASRLSAEIRESDIPVEPQVRGACEILGLDPLYVANEGRMIVILPESEAKSALEILSGFQETANSRAIGAIDAGLSGQLVLKSTLGTHRVVNMLPGEQLPRIC